MKSVYIAIGLALGAPCFAQTAAPTEGELRTALNACAGHWQLVGKGPVSTWTRQYDNGFEHCETLRSALMDAVNSRNVQPPAPPAVTDADVAASKAVAGRIKP